MVMITAGAPSAANAANTASRRSDDDPGTTMIDSTMVVVVMVAVTSSDRCAPMANHNRLYHRTGGRFRQVRPHARSRGCLSADREAAQKQRTCAKKYFHFSLSQFIGFPS